MHGDTAADHIKYTLRSTCCECNKLSEGCGRVSNSDQYWCFQKVNSTFIRGFIWIKSVNFLLYCTYLIYKQLMFTIFNSRTVLFHEAHEGHTEQAPFPPGSRTVGTLHPNVCILEHLHGDAETDVLIPAGLIGVIVDGGAVLVHFTFVAAKPYTFLKMENDIQGWDCKKMKRYEIECERINTKLHHQN